MVSSFFAYELNKILSQEQINVMFFFSKIILCVVYTDM